MLFFFIFLIVPCLGNEVVSWNFGSFIHPKNSSVEFDLKFYAPTEPGEYPVMVYLSGLDGIAPASFYVDFLTKVTLETKAIIITFDIFKPPKFPDKEEKIF